MGTAWLLRMMSSKRTHMESTVQSWKCQSCGIENNEVDRPDCATCGQARPISIFNAEATEVNGKYEPRNTEEWKMFPRHMVKSKDNGAISDKMLRAWVLGFEGRNWYVNEETGYIIC